jgi:hypothetical protein
MQDVETWRSSMPRQIGLRVGILVTALVVWGLVVQAPAAVRAAVRLERVSLPPSPLTGKLGDARPEAPSAPRLEDPECAACQLAAHTTGLLAPDALELHATQLDNGLALRVTSRDAEAREILWKATYARGELLASLRHGAPIHLCEACKASLQRLSDLQISAQRTPDGVLLLYTSANAKVVHDLYQVLHDSGVTAQF